MRLPLSLVAGFAAGWAATLALHQPAIGVLNWLGAVPSPPFRMGATQPFGVPQVWSLAFWGGVWGVALVLAAARQRLLPLVVFGIIFGAVLPTLVSWFVVAPLRGQPVAQGWNLARLWIGPLVNAIWGFGTVLFWRGLGR